MKGFHRINGINWLTSLAEPNDESLVLRIHGNRYLPNEDDLIPVNLPNHWNRVKYILLINNKSA